MIRRSFLLLLYIVNINGKRLEQSTEESDDLIKEAVLNGYIDNIFISDSFDARAVNNSLDLEIIGCFGNGKSVVVCVNGAVAV